MVCLPLKKFSEQTGIGVLSHEVNGALTGVTIAFDTNVYKTEYDLCLVSGLIGDEAGITVQQNENGLHTGVIRLTVNYLKASNNGVEKAIQHVLDNLEMID